MIRGIIAVSAGFLTFIVVATLALPHLETSLTFIPIFVVSVLVSLIVLGASWGYNKFKK